MAIAPTNPFPGIIPLFIDMTSVENTDVLGSVEPSCTVNIKFPEEKEMFSRVKFRSEGKTIRSLRTSRSLPLSSPLQAITILQ
jgi:hypothetical protein